MANILFVSLGSGFEPNFEGNMGFVKQYSQQNHHVQIISVDIESVNMQAERKEGEAYALKRVQYTLQQNNPASYTAFIHEQISDLSDYAQVIICDSIHFLQKTYGNELMAAIKIKNPEMNVTVFDYTSFSMQNAFFRGHDLLSENKNFNFDEFISEYRTRIIDLFKSQTNGDKIVTNIERACKKIDFSKRFGTFFDMFSLIANSNLHLKASVIVFNEDGQEVSVPPFKQLKNYLNSFISSHITIELIEPQITLEKQPISTRFRP
ncbi:hypothetical protein CC99x_004155 [Candidatus Berkiella cookevillensis]|uniref:Uncharacterized protein n=2 Tax=Candidatus Berkiella cookevillensis TaxID=437022 RepID=A0AAE3L388_9GAMM|nr:hypothetical protein [Candidatus Berkiella cookevillensis]MCS5708091.1 hypothetical protein [Candidatus Berkiella cookevillensis]